MPQHPSKEAPCWFTRCQLQLAARSPSNAGKHKEAAPRLVPGTVHIHHGGLSSVLARKVLSAHVQTRKKKISPQTHLRFPQIRPCQPHPLFVALGAGKEVFLCFHSQLVPGNIFFLSRFLPRPIPHSVMSCFIRVSLYACQRFVCRQVCMSCGRTASN